MLPQWGNILNSLLTLLGKLDPQTSAQEKSKVEKLTEEEEDLFGEEPNLSAVAAAGGYAAVYAKLSQAGKKELDLSGILYKEAQMADEKSFLLWSLSNLTHKFPSKFLRVIQAQVSPEMQQLLGNLCTQYSVSLV